MPIPTLDEMQSSLAGDIARVEQAGTELYSAQSMYNRLTLRQNFSTNEAHQASFKEYEPGLAAVEDKALAVITAATRNAYEVKDATLKGQTTLTESEEAAAAVKREFIKEDATSLPYPAMLERIQSAVMNNDRPAMWLYLRYGRMRLANSGADDPLITDMGAKTAIYTALAEIESKLVDSRVKAVHDKAQALLGKAGELDRKARKRRMATERYSFQGAHDVPIWD
jgi:hypothetical protein